MAGERRWMGIWRRGYGFDFETETITIKKKITFASRSVKFLVFQYQILEIVLQSNGSRVYRVMGRQRPEEFGQDIVHVFLLDANTASFEHPRKFYFGWCQEDHCCARGTSPGGSTDPVHVISSRSWPGVLDHCVDFREIQTTASNILGSKIYICNFIRDL